MFACGSGEKRGRTRALLFCAAGCSGAALFFAVNQPPPICASDSDLEQIGCYDPDLDIDITEINYTPSDEKMVKSFCFWFLILASPSLIGVLRSRRHAANPWGKPEEDKKMKPELPPA
jgi:hypothetical protein